LDENNLKTVPQQLNNCMDFIPYRC